MDEGKVDREAKAAEENFRPTAIAFCSTYLFEQVELFTIDFMITSARNYWGGGVREGLVRQRDGKWRSAPRSNRLFPLPVLFLLVIKNFS